MSPPQLPNALRIATLTVMTGMGGDLAGAKIGLYQNNVAISGRITLADLVVADFAGYAISAAVTWLAAHIAPGDVATANASTEQFMATGSATPNLIYGWYLVNAAGSTLLAVQAFDSPQPVNNAGDAVLVFPYVSLPPN